MTRRERGLLLLGLVTGIAVGVMSYRVTPHVLIPGATAVTDPETTVPVEPTENVDSESGTAIALTPEEQSSIGIETTEVQTRNVSREIIAPGKVVDQCAGRWPY